MKIKAQIQFGEIKTKGYNIYTNLSKKLNDKKLKKVICIIGVIKDEAFEMLEEDFNTAKGNNVEFDFVIGVDRKTISEQVLSKINNLSKKVYIYNNNQEENLNCKIYIFEYGNKVEVLLPSSNLTLNGITNDLSNGIEITYSLPKEIDEYNEFMFGIKDLIYPDPKIFELLNDNLIKELSIKRELLVSKGDGKLPSISDYLKNTKKQEINEKEAEEKIKEKIRDIVKDFNVLLDDDLLEVKTEEIKEEKKKTTKKVKEKTEKKLDKKVKKIEKPRKPVDLSKLLLKDQKNKK